MSPLFNFFKKKFLLIFLKINVYKNDICRFHKKHDILFMISKSFQMFFFWGGGYSCGCQDFFKPALFHVHFFGGGVSFFS